tara:strand:- start:63 stop:833 length:771 start_codon:yes stop_codon:yes gene_type:complete
MSQQLFEKIALVTGGSKGIGKVIARRFIAEGASVVIMDKLKRFPSDELKEELWCNHNSYFSGDISSVTDANSCSQFVADQFGKIDIMVLNAGTIPFNHFEDISHKEWKEVININLSGNFNMIKSFETLLKQGGGPKKIVLISSIAGPRVGVPGLSHYSASKSGLNGLMRTLAIEFGRYGINCNSILPGNILTPEEERPDEELSREIQAIPLGRVGNASDIASMAVFLASCESNFITGQEFVVDGGQSILPDFRLIC